MKLKIYVDTSVISAVTDDRQPARRTDTMAFFARTDEFDLGTSVVAREEIEETADDTRRAQMLGVLAGLSVFPLDMEMQELAGRYVLAGIFTDSQIDDALHLAAAVVTRHDILVSWNFRHLVNRRRRALILAANASLGYPPIEVIPPSEV